MISVLSRSFGPMRTLGQGSAALLPVFSGAAFGQRSSSFVVVDNVTIYYAVLPTGMLRSFPPGSNEGRIHGGLPRGRPVHHVQIALVDATTGVRITDARVAVIIAEIGLGGIKRDLEMFLVGDALTYGGYFDFQRRGHYEIRVRVTLPDSGHIVENTFEYRHPRHTTEKTHISHPRMEAK